MRNAGDACSAGSRIINNDHQSHGCEVADLKFNGAGHGRAMQTILQTLRVLRKLASMQRQYIVNVQSLIHDLRSAGTRAVTKLKMKLG